MTHKKGERKDKADAMTNKKGDNRKRMEDKTDTVTNKKGDKTGDKGRQDGHYAKKKKGENKGDKRKQQGERRTQ